MQLAEAYKQMSTQQQIQPPQQAAFSYQQPTNELRPPDPSLMYSNPAEYQRQKDAYDDARFDQRLAQFAQPVIGNVVSQAKWMSQRDPEFADVWERFGGEIEAMARQVPAHMLTKEAYDTFAKVVRGNHYKDFVHAEAQRLAASGGFGTERAAPNGAVPVSTGDERSKLFASDHPWTRKARENNTSEADVRRYCSMRGISPDDYAKDILKGSVLAA